jgi:light-regulated signal transduction histidine kinase (bacteriophytochrome)
MVKAIAEGHGGRILVESELNKGSQFSPSFYPGMGKRMGFIHYYN